MSFYEEVKQLIETKRKEYNDYPNRIFSDFTQENQLKEDYQGRQILELLQNAEDAGSSEVLFKLCKEENYIEVANKGNESFTIDGVESLMLANFSSKSKIKYIGNKGLGFRSVLNWADKIHIFSNGCELKFSKEIITREFEDLKLSDDVKLKLFSKKGLNPNNIPMAILSIPDVDAINNNDSEWLTVIRIFYKEGQEENIESQLKDFSAESLLFLENINAVIIDGIGERIIHKTDNKRIPGKVCIGEDLWEIIKPKNELDDLLPKEFQDAGSKEELHYNVQIAIKDKFTQSSYKLHNYFPTEITVHLPYILHGTFDLDTSRNHSKLTPKNDFILNKLVDLIKQTALDLCNKRRKWDAYRILSPTAINQDSSLIVGLCKKLEEIKKNLAIYPCQDGSYCSIDNATYYGEAFSLWVEKNNFGKYTPNLICPIEPEIKLPEYYFKKKYTKEEFTEIISQISAQITDIDIRVSLIRILFEKEFSIYKGTHYPLLLDTNNNLIPADKQVFTLGKGSVEKYIIPEFSKLTFINNDLFDKLIEAFSEKINEIRNNDEHKSRPLKKLLDNYLNIGSNDILDVVRNLISSLNKFINDLEHSDKSISQNEAINQTIISLYKIFCEDESREGTLKTPIMLCNRNNEIRKCNDLFLGKEYPSGKITEEIFDNIYPSDYYLNSSYIKILQNEHNQKNEATIESFFFWLGVNKHVKFIKIEESKDFTLSDNHEYIKYVYKKLKIKKYQNTGYYYKGLALDNIENTIAKLTNEKLILLIIKENRIKQRLDYSSSEDTLYYSYHNWNIISPRPTYMFFQLSRYFNFEDYLIDDCNLNFINKNPINYDDALFREYGISDHEINNILFLLKAKNSFSELSPERIYNILHSFEENDSTGKNAQSLYKLALNTLEKKNHMPSFEQKKDLRVFAKTGDNKNSGWKYACDVFYSNNTVLPASIIREEWILNAPKRFGEDKVQTYLGIKLFSDFKLELIQDSISINKTLTNELKKELYKLNPYFLSYRLSNVKDEKTQKDAANQLKNYEIILITNGKYKTKEKSELIIQKNEFVKNDNEYYLCIDSEPNLTSLKNDQRFCDAITEILCIVFKVWDNREQFRIAFKYGLKELEHQFMVNGEDELLLNAKVLLGISPAEIEFWQGIYKLKQMSFPMEISSEIQLKEKLKEDLNFEFGSDYKNINFEKFNNKESISFLKNLCDILSISLSQIHSNNQNFKGISEWHHNQLLSTKENLKEKFDYALWYSLSMKEIEQQKTFKDALDRYDGFICSREWQFDPFNFVCNYEEILICTLEKEFNISFNIDYPNDLSIKHNYSYLFSNKDVKENDLQKHEYSLLFFPGYEEIIKEIIQKYAPAIENGAEETISRDVSKITVNTGSLAEVSAPSFLKPPDDSLSLPNTYNSKKEKGKQKAGKRAEVKVVSWLRNEYGKENVKWVSGYSDEARTNDNAGYDIQYRVNKDSDYIYLEVKSYSENFFIISSNEISKGYIVPEKYHIALVQEDSVYFVTDFFMDQKRKEEFDILNCSNSIKPLDFVIYFSIPKVSEAITENQN